MKKILFLPLLQVPTGHHQVADALMESIQKRVQGITLTKVDFLSHINQGFEKAVSKTYFKWINLFPQTYNWAYRHLAYPFSSPLYLQWCENLFMKKMHRMLCQEHPDLIVCTQAYASFLIHRLKQQGHVSIPVVNVYTDFFINKIWGRNGIDYHFVPNTELKQELIDNHGIPAKRIFITGIPIHESFIPTDKKPRTAPPYHVLISGGNAGLGDILSLLQGMTNTLEFHYSVLCGNNNKLFKHIASLGSRNIQPHSYISSRKEMNELYNQADAIITKPGGVTVTEALIKKLPIFIYSALPGQEEINRQYLRSKGLVYELSTDYSIKEQLLSVLTDEAVQTSWRTQVQVFHERLETKAWQKLLEFTEEKRNSASNI